MKHRISIAFCIFTATALVAQDAPKVDEPATKEPKKIDPKKGDHEPADGEKIDIKETVERIVDNAKKAGDRLKAKDPGADTRSIQKEILADIDALIRKSQEPPPPSKSDMNPPPMNMGGGMPPPPMGKGGMGGGMPPPKNGGGGSGNSQPGGSKPSGGRRERKPSPNPGGAKSGEQPGSPGPGGPMPAKADPKDGQKGSNPGVGTFGKTSPHRAEKLADLYKDVWGRLPDRMRQEMDMYYREQFMPRYGELLRQYYAAIAEQKKSGPGDR